MIYTCIAYCPTDKGRNLGYAYNQFMKLVSSEDWVCFIDHDAVWTTKDWYKQLEEIIEHNPDVGLFTAVTNRIGRGSQNVLMLPVTNHDMNAHRAVGKELGLKKRLQIADVTNNEIPISGVVMLLKKSTWAAVGGFKDGFLGVDNDMHLKLRALGKKVCVMSGVYVYHWYRADGDLSHIPK